jgi:HlyD family secretion protein
MDEVSHPIGVGLYNGVAMSTPQGKPMADLSSLRIDDRSRKTSKRGKRLAWLAAVLIILLAGGAFAYHFKNPKPVVEVTTARSAANAPETALLNASGYVTPRRRSSVAAKITGRVIEVDTDEGMHIKEGQIIARLDCAESDAALASAKADRIATQASMDDLQVNLANADRELKRAEKLTDAGVSTPQALDTARTLTESYRARISLTKEQVVAADRKIDIAQENVNNCTIRAPFTGQVVSKDAQVGEMVSPISAGGGFTRTGIATIVDMQSLEIEVDVNESYIARVKPHQRVSATLDAYPNWRIPSHVRTIIPTADRQKATVKVRITFDQLDPRILPDMGVKVAFLGEEQPRAAAGGAAAVPKALIPGSAVRQQDGKAGVFLVHDGIVERRAVTLGSQRGDDVEVLAGVAQGDTLVAKVPENLRDGQAVEVKQ